MMTKGEGSETGSGSQCMEGPREAEAEVRKALLCTGKAARVLAEENHCMGGSRCGCGDTTCHGRSGSRGSRSGNVGTAGSGSGSAEDTGKAVGVVAEAKVVPRKEVVAQAET
jgi:hypothetical protein